MSHIADFVDFGVVKTAVAVAVVVVVVVAVAVAVDMKNLVLPIAEEQSFHYTLLDASC